MTDSSKSGKNIRVLHTQTQPKEESPPEKQPDFSTTMSTSPIPGANKAINTPNDKSALVEDTKRFPLNIPGIYQFVTNQNGKAYAQNNDTKNASYILIDSKTFRGHIRRIGQKQGLILRKSDVNDTVDFLQSYAEEYGDKIQIHHRIAPLKDGIEVDIGDRSHTRVRVLPNSVDIITEGSTTPFYRSPVSCPMVMPAAEGDINLLKKYLNMRDVDKILFIAWISYTLAHPKIASVNYLILLLQGDHGSGKTVICSNIILPLIDPGIVGVQSIPRSANDIVVAAQNSHVICYDNLRSLSHSMADTLCIAATGGSICTRQLYTNADQHVSHLHVALVLNGIHAFMDQPDLAQRSLPIRLKTLSSTDRKSEAAIQSELQKDLPVIFRGFLELISKIFAKLPQAEVTNPERMFEFSQWLAAFELVDEVPAGTYQSAYSSALNEAQLDTLLCNPLADAVYRFANERIKGSWSGTPTQLLTELDQLVNIPTQRSREWPQNAISLSKRLTPLSAGLATQGISVKLSRAKDRIITITNEEDF